MNEYDPYAPWNEPDFLPCEELDEKLVYDYDIKYRDIEFIYPEKFKVDSLVYFMNEVWDVYYSEPFTDDEDVKGHWKIQAKRVDID